MEKPTPVTPPPVEKRVTDIIQLREGIMSLENGIISLLPPKVKRAIRDRQISDNLNTRSKDTAYQLVQLD